MAPDPDERLKALAATMSAFADVAIDDARMVEILARGAGELLGCFVAVSLVSDDQQWLEPIASFDADPVKLERIKATVAAAALKLTPELPTTRVIQTGKRILVRQVDPTLAPVRLSKEDGPKVEALGFVSYLLVPLRTHGKCIGLMSLVRHGAGAAPLEERDADLAQVFADHAALAISNARLAATGRIELDERTRLADRLRVLSELAHDFAAATADYEGLLKVITQRLGTVMGEACSIRMVGESGVAFDELGAVYDPDPVRVQYLHETMIAQPQRVGEGVSGRVAQSGKSILISQITPAQIAAIEPRFRAIIEKLELRSVIAVPLRARGQVIGVVSMFRTRSHQPYTVDDQHLVEDLASHAALAIANSRLLQSTARELAERRKAEDALRRTEEQLRQAQKMEAVGQLAGGIAHDFNNLLSVVLSYSSLILGTITADDPIRPEIQEIEKAGERAADLTRQLLAFSRQQVLEPRVINLNDVVSGIDGMLRRLVGEDITLRSTAGRDLRRVKADPGHIEQVIMNLVVNARDAMPRGGHITLETANVELDELYAKDHIDVTPGPYVMLAVSDTGLGMDKATQERIFDPFFTTKEKGKGTGLGLSTVFGIVKQNGGSIWVYSEPNRGTTFKIFLPVTTEEAIAVAAPATVGSLRGTETILLVEDEDQVRLVASGVLRKNGYRVLEASNGTDALLVARSHPGIIHLVLTDVVMPQMSGAELVNQLLPLRPQTRVLYMSGYTDDAIIHHRILERGVTLLQKPITPDLLLRKVRAILDANGQ